MRTRWSLAISLPSLLWAAGAEAHIQLMSPTARYVQDDNGLKTGPCGSGTATGTVTKLVPGQMLTVAWKESVSHAGHYRIALSANQSDFTEPASLDIPNPLPSWDLADGIQDKTGTQNYSQAVQLPNVECPACVLQLIQVMSTGTDGTNTGPFSGVYHACADLAITAGTNDGGPGPDAGTDARPDVSARDANDSGGPIRDGAVATGGALGSGGAIATGGITTAGGATGSGGATASGGNRGGNGGATASGGNGGGSGGATASGGRSGGGGAGMTAAGGSSSVSSGGSGAGGASSGSGGATNGEAPGTGGGSTGSGGAMGNAGGSGGNPGSASGTGGAAGTVAGASSSGCACQVGSATPGRATSASLFLLGFWLAARRKPRLHSQS